MKRIVAVLLSLSMAFTLVVSASATEEIDPETGVSRILQARELQAELQNAEIILGGESKVEFQEIQRVGDYVVETRLYVLEDDFARARTGECGGVSSHTWRRWGSSTWDIKVMFGAFFYYNGQTAICRPDESEFWVSNQNNSIITTQYNPQYSYNDSSILTSKATASCSYARDEPGTSSDTEIFGTLKVTCTKDGSVGIQSEVEHRY